jgi:hypothetical protein
MVRNLENV